jgi:tetratricopeptide (TPR) repeat protein
MRFQLQYGMWRYNSAKANLRASEVNGSDLLMLGEQISDPGYAAAAHRALATTVYRRGRFAECRDHARSGIDRFCKSRERSFVTGLLGDDPGIDCRCLLAVSQWHLGHVAAALAAQKDALAIARSAATPHGLAVAYYLAAYLYDFMRDFDASKDIAQLMVEISTEYGFRWWLAAGLIRRGWAIGMLGDAEAGSNDVAAGLRLWHACGAEVGLPYWSALAAQIATKRGDMRSATELLDDAIVRMNTTDERWWEAEIYRLKGEVLLMQGESESTAVNYLQTARDLARRSGSRSLELKANLTLLDHLTVSNNIDGARLLLRDVRASWPPETENAASSELTRLERLLRVSP